MGISESIYNSSQGTSLNFGAERLPGLKLFFFEGASLDAREGNQASEDFVTYKYKDESLSFIVCDGVQQTVDSSIAARLFGTRIVEMLHTVNGDKKIIEDFANKIRSIIDRIILDMPVDPNHPMPDFHLRARTELGAQVKFACGIIDQNKKRIDLYWAGDVRIAVYDKKGKILFSWEKDNDQFWSTRNDYSLNLDKASWHLDYISRISVTSDGIREDFKYILSGKITLDDLRLVQQRYGIGVDDISGFDAVIEHDVNFEKLHAVQDVKVVNKRLVWEGQPRAERYRIYHSSSEGVLRAITDIPSSNNSYDIPSELLSNGDIFVQAISSWLISSELSKAISYVPVLDSTLISQKVNILPEKDLVSSKTDIPRNIPVNSPVHEIRPKRPWIKLTLGFAGLLGVAFLLLSTVGLSVFRKYFATPTSTTYIVTLTSTLSTPSFTAIPTITEDTTTPDLLTAVIVEGESAIPSSVVLSSTPNATSDVNLSECQRSFLISEPDSWKKYQIQPGDTLYQLSQIYNISVGELMRVNCFQTSNIASGSYMLIPVSNSN